VIRSFRILVVTSFLAISNLFLLQAAYAAPKQKIVKPEDIWTPVNTQVLCTTIKTKKGFKNVGVGAFGKKFMLASDLIARLLKRSDPKVLKQIKLLRRAERVCAKSYKPEPTPTPDPVISPNPTPTPTLIGNSSPVANGANYSVIEASFIDFNLSGTDADGDSLTFTIVTQPSQGTISGTLPSLRYTRNSHYLGNDSLVFKVSDGKAESQATIAISTVPLTGDFVGSDSLIPYRDQLSEDECRALVRNILLGGKGEETVAECQALGLNAFIDSYLNKSISTATWNQALALALDANGRWNETELRRFWNYIYVAAEDPLRMRLAHIMGDHFAASAKLYYGDGGQHEYIRDYVTLLINEAFNFETLTDTFIGADRLMADWLNNNVNTKNSLNENFARELMELFTTRLYDQFTGLPNYTEDDVAELTKALSGFKKYWNAGTYYLMWDSSLWYSGIKNLFPGTQYASAGNFKFYDVTPILLYTHKGTARSVAYLLASELSSPDVPESLIEELANDLRATGYDLKVTFLPKLLKSSFMFKKGGGSSCITSPIQQVVTFMRSTQLPLGLPNVGVLDAMRSFEMNSGETPSEPRSVFGNMGCGVGGRTTAKAYGQVWVSSQQWLLERQRSATDLLKALRDIHTDAVYDRFIPKSGATGEEVVTYITKILGIKLGEAEKSVLVTRYMNRKKTGSSTYTNSPFAQLSAAEKRWKIAGALEILFGRHELGNVF